MWCSHLQEPLGQPEQRRISNELRHLTDLTNSLANLDIAIGFLVSVGGEPESLLASFMTGTLRMKTSIHSQQVIHPSSASSATQLLLMGVMMVTYKLCGREVQKRVQTVD